jgi:LPXTG-motif cell wall-anchored protein
VIEPGPRQPVVHTARDGAPMKLAAAGLMLLGAGAAVMILRRRR